MNEIPYTTPEEDPFSVRPRQLPRRRRSSLLEKWINEQQKTDSEPPPSSHLDPYSHSPGGEVSLSRDDVATLENYDLVSDDDIPEIIPPEKEVPATPTTARYRRTSKLLHTPSAFRTFNLPFRSSSPPAPSLPTDLGSPRSRFSFLPRPPRYSTDATIGNGRSSQQHSRSTSLSTLNLTGKAPYSGDIPNPGSSTKWRPSVLGHFASSSTSQTSVPSDTAYTPSRPSMSSADTYTSGTATTMDTDLLISPSRMNFMDSIRFRSKSNGGMFNPTSGSNSARSHKYGNSLGNPSTPALSIIDSVASTSTLAHRSQTTRIPFVPKPTSRLANSRADYDYEDAEDEDHNTCYPTVQPLKQQYDPTRPHVAYSSGGALPRVNLASLSSRHRKKKKLVVSGVGPNELRKFEGVKRWCEVRISFLDTPEDGLIDPEEFWRNYEPKFTYRE
ncbi:hypothetical protein H0H81_007457 [Sphagnurus paluster]|uniref:Uncharacterized protein n=1 Tax=Sphagnurus paluster TaxID=117069 RepID=A0A9P7KJ67_9AGAR|nr:hypothetical protein H0H81_007457 [Sphagnurus paluster]